jgi:hypothetical protein
LHAGIFQNAKSLVGCFKNHPTGKREFMGKRKRIIRLSLPNSPTAANRYGVLQINPTKFEGNMNKLIIACCLIMVSVTSRGQNAKPTKEETFNYLIEQFSSKKLEYFTELEHYSSGNSIRTYTETVYSFTDFRIDKCTMSFNLVSYVEKYSMRKTARSDEIIVKFDLDFGKIESVVDQTRSDYSELHSFVFSQKGSNGKINYITIPFISIVKDSEYNFKEQKVYKALNYLRKLCGAPEPISFD